MRRSDPLLFKAIAVLLPFIFLALFEIVLRIFDYGNSTDLFIEYPANKNFLVLNPDASKKYFVNQSIATTGNAELFKKEKDTQTMRIFILGESTTLGYPYFHNASFHRWLQYRLMHTFPDRNFEIINLALTAVNSYTVLGFAKEIIKYKPDVVLIYSGHNEYYGTLGVASTDKIGGSPYVVNLILSLREFRVMQLLTNVYAKFSGSAHSGTSGGTRLKMMIADGKIRYNSDLYNRGVEQFTYNMKETLRVLNKNNIPVFVSNLVSNEKDMKPFVSFSTDSIGFPEFKENFKLGENALANRDSSLAYQYFQKANDVYREHARCNYYLGELAFQQKDTVEAKVWFTKAKDFDGLRFRAPEQINVILSELCAQYSNAHLVDTRTAFERKSRNKVIGDELILEHIHPNLIGYAVLSDVFYQALKKDKCIVLVKEKEISFKQLMDAMPITTVDSLAGMYKIAKLKNSWPFSQALHHDSVIVKTEEEKLAWKLSSRQITWQEAMDSLYTYYVNQNKFFEARKVTEGLVLENPTDPVFYERAAMLTGRLGDIKNTIFYFKKAFELSPTFDKARYLLVLYLKQDKPDEALPYVHYAMTNKTSNFDLTTLKKRVEDIIKLKRALASDSINIEVINHIAHAYLSIDNVDGALQYIRSALAIDRNNKEALLLHSRIMEKEQITKNR